MFPPPCCSVKHLMLGSAIILALLSQLTKTAALDGFFVSLETNLLVLAVCRVLQRERHSLDDKPLQGKEKSLNSFSDGWFTPSNAQFSSPPWSPLWILHCLNLRNPPKNDYEKADHLKSAPGTGKCFANLHALHVESSDSAH